MKVGLYTRVSTQEQAKEGYSIGEQIERLTKYADAMNWTVYKTYTDGGYTGANTNRPALQSMIEDIKNGKIEKVVVYKLDRLSRSQLDTLYLIEKVFLVNGCDFVSMSENFDTSTPFGRAMIGILAVFAQLEREQIKERMIVGKEGRAKEGLWHGGVTPIGYDYDPSTNMLIVNDFEAMIIHELYDQFERGVPLYKLAEEFENKGYKTKYGLINRVTMRRLLSNPIYTGKLSANGEIIQGRHEAIISVEQFEAVQPILKTRAEKYRINKKYSTLLSSFLWCSCCSARYGKRSFSSSKSEKYKYSYYMCYSKSKLHRGMIKDPNCKNKNWNVKKLDKIIIDEIKKLKLDPNYIYQIRTEKTEQPINKQATIKKEIERINNQIVKYMDLYVVGSINIDLIDSKVKPLVEKIKGLEEELETLKNIPEELTNYQILDLVETFEKELNEGDLASQRLILDQLIDRIEIDGDDITIYWTFS